MEPLSFVRALQLTDSFFPVGAFAYSDGLETASTAGLISDANSLAEWMTHYIEGVFIPCDGLAVAKCMRALDGDDIDTLVRIDEELSAIRPAGSVRRSSALVGKRLLSVYGSMCRDQKFQGRASCLPYGNSPAAYAVVYFHEGLSIDAAVVAFGYNRLAGIVSAGLRLISMGQQQGQLLLTECVRRLPGVAGEILRNLDEPLRSFSPVLDIQQMNHQYVYSRLFRS
jgi:urease accessory protein